MFPRLSKELICTQTMIHLRPDQGFLQPKPWWSLTNSADTSDNRHVFLLWYVKETNDVQKTLQLSIMMFKLERLLNLLSCFLVCNEHYCIRHCWPDCHLVLFLSYSDDLKAGSWDIYCMLMMLLCIVVKLKLEMQNH